MSEFRDRKGALVENLLDARCDEETVRECLRLAQEGKKKQFLSRLYCHRKNLVGAMHEEQRAIDCLDYLIFQVEKSE